MQPFASARKDRATGRAALVTNRDDVIEMRPGAEDLGHAPCCFRGNIDPLFAQRFYDRPFFLTLHAEMESDVNSTPGSGMTATDFRDFFRHTVQVLRANGADRVVPIVNYTGAPHWGYEEWWDDLYARWKEKMLAAVERMKALKFEPLPEFEPLEVVTEGRGRSS